VPRRQGGEILAGPSLRDGSPLPRRPFCSFLATAGDRSPNFGSTSGEGFPWRARRTRTGLLSIRGAPSVTQSSQALAARPKNLAATRHVPPVRRRPAFSQGLLLRIAIGWICASADIRAVTPPSCSLKNPRCRPLAGSIGSTKDSEIYAAPIRSAIGRRGAWTPRVRRWRCRNTGWLRSGRPEADRRRGAGCAGSLVERPLPARGPDRGFSGEAGWWLRRWMSVLAHHPPDRDP
jgi:hypothetical protein